MVYKVSKGGVRSGNTIRNLGSCRIRRYIRQGCIVGRSNLRPKEVPTFLDSHIKDKMISSALSSTGVALSLNKKKRWLLPATVGHMIETGSFSDDKTMVSLLERHKLKRRANCVSFICNQGRIRHVAPRQNRYFSLNLNNINNTQSNRRRKQQKSQLIKKEKSMKVKREKDIIIGPVRTAEDFTSEKSKKYSDASNVFMSSKPEYRLEVFYPCPQTCSLTYNPKYTNVNMEFGEEGGVELKSEKRISKKGGRHRKRFTLKDLEMYEPEIVSSEIEEDLDDDPEQFENHPATDVQANLKYQEAEERFKNSVDNLEKQNEDDCDENVFHIWENELAILVAQAEKTRFISENSQKQRRTRKRSNIKHDGLTLALKSSQKSHIVYKSDSGLECENKNKEATTSHVTLHSAKVILKSSDATPGNLRAKFGRLYAEAESEPRRFMIDVTEDIQKLLSPYRNTEPSAVYTSFLVFIHDGVYDEGLDTYRVIFNTNCCNETEVFKNYLPFEKTTFEEIMNRVASLVLDMKEDNKLDFNTDQFCGSASISLMKFVSDLLNVSVQASHLYDEFRRVSLTEAMQESTDFTASLDDISRSLDFEIFCDICYENINPTQTWDKCGTKLSKCSHIFCDDCWRSHFRAKMMDGSVKMTCPGYECDQKVGLVTLLSLLHVSEVCKLFQRMREEEADSSTNSRWCPNRNCGRVVKLDIERSTNGMSIDVTCSCGQEFCFSCLSNPHWPATCEQAEEYADKLDALKSLTKSTDYPYSEEIANISPYPGTQITTKFLEVEGRLCPNCSRFFEMDKNFGRCHVFCKCGHIFCWYCMEGCAYHRRCLPKAPALYEFKLKLKIRHLIISPHFSVYSDPSNKVKPEASRQKRKMYKRAVLERQDGHTFPNRKEIKEMTKQIAHVSQKDLHYKREILSICGLNVDDIDTAGLTLLPLVYHVSKFLHSCCEIKRTLHHVAEFTFVLLQDAPDSVDKRRILRLANDLSSCCSFIKSILASGQRQDMRTAVKRLADVQMLAKKTLIVLLSSVDKLKC